MLSSRLLNPLIVEVLDLLEELALFLKSSLGNVEGLLVVRQLAPSGLDDHLSFLAFHVWKLIFDT